MTPTHSWHKLVEWKKTNAYTQQGQTRTEQRYKYRTFEKGTNRHLFRAEPRRVRYVVGNKFTLDGDAVENQQKKHNTASHKGSMTLTVTSCLMKDSFC